MEKYFVVGVLWNFEQNHTRCFAPAFVLYAKLGLPDPDPSYTLRVTEKRFMSILAC